MQIVALIFPMILPFRALFRVHKNQPFFEFAQISLFLGSHQTLFWIHIKIFKFANCYFDFFHVFTISSGFVTFDAVKSNAISVLTFFVEKHQNCCALRGYNPTIQLGSQKNHSYVIHHMNGFFTCRPFGAPSILL